MAQSAGLALAMLAVTQQIRSLLGEKRTFLPALKMTLMTHCDRLLRNYGAALPSVAAVQVRLSSLYVT